MKFGSYKILTEERLIVEYHSGEINVDDFILSREIVSSDSAYSPDYDLIFDFRDVDMIVSPQDIVKFVDFFRNFSPILGTRKSAYLTSRPNEVVITTLFSRGIGNLPIVSKTFSTLGGVVDWMDNKEINPGILLEILTELKTQPNSLYA